MKVRVLKYSVLLILLCTTPCFSAEYKYGIFDFPPFSEIKSDGSYGGYVTDMIKVLNHTGVKYEVVGLPLKRLYKGLITGEVSIFIGIKSKTYGPHVIYSKMPVSVIELRVYTRGDVPMPSKYTDLKEKRIIKIRGYSFGPLNRFLFNPENRIKFEPTNDHVNALRMLRSKRADYLLNYKLPVNKSYKSVFEDKKMLFSRQILKMELYFIVSKKAENNKQLMKKIIKSYYMLDKKGVLEFSRF